MSIASKTRRGGPTSEAADLAALLLLEALKLDNLLLDRLLGLGDDLHLRGVGLGAEGLELVLLELDGLLVNGDDLLDLRARGARAVDELASLGALDHAGRVEHALVGALVDLEVGGLLEVGVGGGAALVLADLLQAVDLGLELVLGRLDLGLVGAKAGIDLLLLELDRLAVGLQEQVQLGAGGARAVDEVTSLGTLDGTRSIELALAVGAALAG